MITKKTGLRNRGRQPQRFELHGKMTLPLSNFLSIFMNMSAEVVDEHALISLTVTFHI
jgi:hypothetical protein